MRWLMLLFACGISCSSAKSSCERACVAACDKSVECLNGRGSCGKACAFACEDGPHVTFGVDVDLCVAGLEALTCDELELAGVSGTVPIKECEGLLPVLPGGPQGPLSGPDGTVEPQQGGFSFDPREPADTLRSLAFHICQTRQGCSEVFEIECEPDVGGKICRGVSFSGESFEDCVARKANELFDESCFSIGSDTARRIAVCINDLAAPSCDVTLDVVDDFAFSLSGEFDESRGTVLPGIPVSCQGLGQETDCPWATLLPMLGFSVDCPDCRSLVSDG